MIGSFQPEVGRRLSTHPITDRLVMAVNFSKIDYDFNNSHVSIIPEDTGIAGPGSWLRGTVVYEQGNNVYGKWAGFAGAAFNSKFDWPRSDFVPASGGMTLLMLYEKRDATPRASMACHVNTATVAEYCHVALPYSDGIVYFAYGGNTAGTTRLDVPGLTFGADRWVFTTGARGMECWQNGIKRGSNAANPTRTATSTTPFQLGAKTSQVIFSDIAHYNAFAMWSRQLLPEEIIAISADPYMLWDMPSPLERAYRSAAATATDAGLGHPVNKITQLMPYGLPGRRYGNFAGRNGFRPSFLDDINVLIGPGKAE